MYGCIFTKNKTFVYQFKMYLRLKRNNMLNLPLYILKVISGQGNIEGSTVHTVA